MNPTVTTTEYEDVSVATTYTETATHGGTDTIHVIEPINPTVTTTEYGSVSAATTITYTNPPGETDTVLVIDPLNPTVTTTEYEDVSVAHYLYRELLLTVVPTLFTSLNQSTQLSPPLSMVLFLLQPPSPTQPTR